MGVGKDGLGDMSPKKLALSGISCSNQERWELHLAYQNSIVSPGGGVQVSPGLSMLEQENNPPPPLPATLGEIAEAMLESSPWW